jgi:hypothetical protein
MKRVVLGLLGLGVAACQQSAPAKQVAAPATSGTQTAKPVTADSVPTVARGAWPVRALPSIFSAADTLSRPMRELLATHNLAVLWQHYDTIGVHPNPTFEGYLGPDRYRFAMVFNQVQRDPHNPILYQVKGKCRYPTSKNIRPFSGTLTVRQITNLNYPGFLQYRAEQFSEGIDSLAGRTYTARAQLQLWEEKKENSGLFEGEVLLDFYIIPGQAPDYVYVFSHEGFDDQLPTRGAGLIVQGKRLNLTTGQVKSFLVSPRLAAIAPRIFKDFMLDERMGQINPKYAKLGWAEYWENEEWWADSPKPSLNL